MLSFYPRQGLEFVSGRELILRNNYDTEIELELQVHSSFHVQPSSARIEPKASLSITVTNISAEIGSCTVLRANCNRTFVEIPLKVFEFDLNKVDVIRSCEEENARQAMLIDELKKSAPSISKLLDLEMELEREKYEDRVRRATDLVRKKENIIRNLQKRPRNPSDMPLRFETHSSAVKSDLKKKGDYSHEISLANEKIENLEQLAESQSDQIQILSSKLKEKEDEIDTQNQVVKCMELERNTWQIEKAAFQATEFDLRTQIKELDDRLRSMSSNNDRNVNEVKSVSTTVNMLTSEPAANAISVDNKNAGDTLLTPEKLDLNSSEYFQKHTSNKDILGSGYGTQVIQLTSNTSSDIDNYMVAQSNNVRSNIAAIVNSKNSIQMCSYEKNDCNIDDYMMLQSKSTRRSTTKCDYKKCDIQICENENSKCKMEDYMVLSSNNTRRNNYMDNNIKSWGNMDDNLLLAPEHDVVNDSELYIKQDKSHATFHTYAVDNTSDSNKNIQLLPPESVNESVEWYSKTYDSTMKFLQQQNSNITGVNLKALKGDNSYTNGNTRDVAVQVCSPCCNISTQTELEQDSSVLNIHHSEIGTYLGVKAWWLELYEKLSSIDPNFFKEGELTTDVEKLHQTLKDQSLSLILANQSILKTKCEMKMKESMFMEKEMMYKASNQSLSITLESVKHTGSVQVAALQKIIDKLKFGDTEKEGFIKTYNDFQKQRIENIELQNEIDILNQLLCDEREARVKVLRELDDIKENNAVQEIANTVKSLESCKVSPSLILLEFVGTVMKQKDIIESLQKQLKSLELEPEEKNSKKSDAMETIESEDDSSRNGDMAWATLGKRLVDNGLHKRIDILESNLKIARDDLLATKTESAQSIRLLEDAARKERDDLCFVLNNTQAENSDLKEELDALRIVCIEFREKNHCISLAGINHGPPITKKVSAQKSELQENYCSSIEDFEEKLRILENSLEVKNSQICMLTSSLDAVRGASFDTLEDISACEIRAMNEIGVDAIKNQCVSLTKQVRLLQNQLELANQKVSKFELEVKKLQREKLKVQNDLDSVQLTVQDKSNRNEYLAVELKAVKDESRKRIFDIFNENRQLIVQVRQAHRNHEMEKQRAEKNFSDISSLQETLKETHVLYNCEISRIRSLYQQKIDEFLDKNFSGIGYSRDLSSEALNKFRDCIFEINEKKGDQNQKVSAYKKLEQFITEMDNSTCASIHKSQLLSWEIEVLRNELLAVNRSLMHEKSENKRLEARLELSLKAHIGSSATYFDKHSDDENKRCSWVYLHECLISLTTDYIQAISAKQAAEVQLQRTNQNESYSKSGADVLIPDSACDEDAGVVEYPKCVSICGSQEDSMVIKYQQKFYIFQAENIAKNAEVNCLKLKISALMELCNRLRGDESNARKSIPEQLMQLQAELNERFISKTNTFKQILEKEKNSFSEEVENLKSMIKRRDTEISRLEMHLFESQIGPKEDFEPLIEKIVEATSKDDAYVNIVELERLCTFVRRVKEQLKDQQKQNEALEIECDRLRMDTAKLKLDLHRFKSKGYAQESVILQLKNRIMQSESVFDENRPVSEGSVCKLDQSLLSNTLNDTKMQIALARSENDAKMSFSRELYLRRLLQKRNSRIEKLKLKLNTRESMQSDISERSSTCVSAIRNDCSSHTDVMRQVSTNKLIRRVSDQEITIAQLEIKLSESIYAGENAQKMFGGQSFTECSTCRILRAQLLEAESRRVKAEEERDNNRITNEILLPNNRNNIMRDCNTLLVGNSEQQGKFQILMMQKEEEHERARESDKNSIFALQVEVEELRKSNKKNMAAVSEHLQELERSHMEALENIEKTQKMKNVNFSKAKGKYCHPKNNQRFKKFKTGSINVSSRARKIKNCSELEERLKEVENELLQTQDELRAAIFDKNALADQIDSLKQFKSNEHRLEVGEQENPVLFLVLEKAKAATAQTEVIKLRAEIQKLQEMILHKDNELKIFRMDTLHFKNLNSNFSAKNVLDQLAESNESSKAEVAKLRTRLTQVLKSRSLKNEEQIGSHVVTQELNQAKSALIDVRSETDRQSKYIVQLKDSLHNSNKMNEELTNRIAGFQKRFNHTQRDLLSKVALISDLRKKIDDVEKNNQNSSKVELKTIIDCRTNAQNEVSIHSDRIRAQRVEIMRLRNQLAEKNEALAKEQEKALNASAEIESLKIKISTHERKVTVMKSEIAANAAIMHSTTSQIALLDEENIKYKQKLEICQQEANQKSNGLVKNNLNAVRSFEKVSRKLQNFQDSIMHAFIRIFDIIQDKKANQMHEADDHSMNTDLLSKCLQLTKEELSEIICDPRGIRTADQRRIFIKNVEIAIRSCNVESIVSVMSDMLLI